MDLTQDRINALLVAPSESLNVEIKSWIDPASPEGKGKIAKAALALRNRNGGYLIIGLDDSTMLPVTDGRPANIRTAFHIDILQAIISKYAAIPFEVGVGFAFRDGQEFPVIGVPEGSIVPVACKADLHVNGIKHLNQNAVYFRTLQANGTPSSAAINWGDWRELADICFENREADIGRFLRRHLDGNGRASLASALSAKGTKEFSLRERAAEALAEGDRRRDQLIQTITAEERKAAGSLGSWSVALVFAPSRADASNRTFLNTISSANPQLTGWPIWLDSRRFIDKSAAPRLMDGVWQSVIANIGAGWSSHLDIQTMDASGVFYLWRLLQDDLTNKVEPLTKLDPILIIYRVAETIAVGLSFARALGQAEDTRLGFLFRWDKLRGRTLDAWADRISYFSPGREAFDQRVESFVEVSAGTPVSAIAPAVGHVIAPLMRAFDGFEISQNVVEQRVQRLLERKL
ncbi:ATP-binding protein [Paracoccus sediminis]|uniref:ATP-binding protein n=1 Tax=Paracoccus sediminis TaxID=1214787 RepID=A0A238XGU4_9RHOB|nr:ATP-binding protein [Paracoccus sediminis]TBN48506.1 ATP-binding protein [Paracoccus sediminis]SNR58215.1 hypothetical protein SAMN06265378_11045 [Paracoccus sediminis]